MERAQSQLVGSPLNYKSAQGALAEVKQFLCIMYGACLRFYNTVIRLSQLEEMKEDIIEVLTKMVFKQDKMAQLQVQLCRVCTIEEERILQIKIKDLEGAKPGQIGLS